MIQIPITVYVKSDIVRSMIKHAGPYWVYLVQCSKGTYYAGYTDHIARRLALHNSGKGAKYLRGRGPVQLVFCQEYACLGSALSAERALKKLTHQQKKALAERYSAGDKNEL